MCAKKILLIPSKKAGGKTKRFLVVLKQDAFRYTTVKLVAIARVKVS